MCTTDSHCLISEGCQSKYGECNYLKCGQKMTILNLHMVNAVVKMDYMVQHPNFVINPKVVKLLMVIVDMVLLILENVNQVNVVVINIMVVKLFLIVLLLKVVYPNQENVNVEVLLVTALKDDIVVNIDIVELHPFIVVPDVNRPMVDVINKIFIKIKLN